MCKTIRITLAGLLAAALLLPLLCACTAAETEPDPDKLSIVCTDFPAYDFARAIAGDRAEILLLIKPGAESHSFEPTPKEILSIESCDLFICNGGESEAWAERLYRDGGIERRLVMMDCVETVTEEEKEGMYVRGEEDEEELDEHVWTSPVNAAAIVSAICDELCKLSPDDATYFRANCDAYRARLAELDSEFRRTVANAKHDVLVFADRFPMRYFTLEYGLDYFAAFPGCSGETEPSAKTVAFLIDKVRDEKLPAVLYMEFSNQKMADVICEETGCKKRPFYSVHNVTAEQLEAGLGYLDLMEINLKSLKEALG